MSSIEMKSSLELKNLYIGSIEKSLVSLALSKEWGKYLISGWGDIVAFNCGRGDSDPEETNDLMKRLKEIGLSFKEMPYQTLIHGKAGVHVSYQLNLDSYNATELAAISRKVKKILTPS